MALSIGMYIHIPFCVQKCAYCDFLSGPATRERQQAYVAALRREIAREAAQYAGYEVQTVFFGGGTPSILEEGALARLLECCRAHYHINYDAEITVEMNPGTVDYNKLMDFKNAGVNRLSIGLQSADNAALRLLGRIHTYEDFLQTYQLARKAGYTNINIDLMSALPGQRIEDWVQTLETVTALQPEHISAYSLILEEGTRLYDRLNEYPPVPDEDEDREMYQETKRILAEKGYQRYEISNYAKAGYACRHNCIYWQRGGGHTANYAGFGLGASSTVKDVRWRNTEDMERYLGFFAENSDHEYHGEKTDVHELSKAECMEEYMFLGLRMTDGVSRQEFADSFGVEMNDIYGEALHRWERQGMLVQQGDAVRLTDAGIDVSNVVLADFLL